MNLFVMNLEKLRTSGDPSTFLTKDIDRLSTMNVFALNTSGPRNVDVSRIISNSFLSDAGNRFNSRKKMDSPRLP